MLRLKRAQFPSNDDRLLQQILNGTKTAATDLAKNWNLPAAEFDEGGYLPQDLVEVYDQHNRLRCHIRIIEVYETTFATLPEKLWRGEACASAEEFQSEHQRCWSDQPLTNDTPLIAFHFQLVPTTS